MGRIDVYMLMMIICFVSSVVAMVDGSYLRAGFGFLMVAAWMDAIVREIFR